MSGTEQQYGRKFYPLPEQINNPLPLSFVTHHNPAELAPSGVVGESGYLTDQA